MHGPVTRLWTVDLPLRGRTTGVAFRPGGFAALFGIDVSTIAGTVGRAGDVLTGITRLEREVLGEPDEATRRALLTDWLTRVHEEAAERIAGDTAYRAILDAVEVMGRRDRVRVEQVAEEVHCASRTLQRWFLRYVGVSPLHLLRRRRLQDATAALDVGEQDLAGLAVDLGWADHAHFTRDFRAVVGVPPKAYRRGVRRGAVSSGAPEQADAGDDRQQHAGGE